MAASNGVRFALVAAAIALAFLAQAHACAAGSPLWASVLLPGGYSRVHVRRDRYCQRGPLARTQISVPHTAAPSASILRPSNLDTGSPVRCGLRCGVRCGRPGVARRVCRRAALHGRLGAVRRVRGRLAGRDSCHRRPVDAACEKAAVRQAVQGAAAAAVRDRRPLRRVAASPGGAPPRPA